MTMTMIDPVFSRLISGIYYNTGSFTISYLLVSCRHARNLRLV